MIILSAILGSFLTAIQIIPGSGPNQHGRTGNDHLKQDQYEEAAAEYQEGLSSYQPTEETDQTYHGLQNNLGLTLHRQQNFEEAGRAFEEALVYAPNEDAEAMASFNAGNNAFSSEQLEQALEHYRKALMADPDNEDAKFNFEFVSRQLQEQQNQEQQSDGDDQEEQNEQQQDQEQNEEEDQDDEQSENQNEPQQDQDDEQNNEQDEQQQNSDQNEQEQPEEQQEPSDEQREMPLTKEQAERILEALGNEEEQLLREVQKVEGRPRRVAKDW